VSFEQRSVREARPVDWSEQCRPCTAVQQQQRRLRSGLTVYSLVSGPCVSWTAHRSLILEFDQPRSFAHNLTPVRYVLLLILSSAPHRQHRYTASAPWDDSAARKSTICIARGIRTLVRHPSLAIFEEPTSSVGEVASLDLNSFSRSDFNLAHFRRLRLHSSSHPSLHLSCHGCLQESNRPLGALRSSRLRSDDFCHWLQESK